METPFISVNETHMFVFPVVDFINKPVNQPFSSEVLKLPSFGDWWIWGVNATRVATYAANEMPSGTPISCNIYDPGLSEYWWTGGSLLNNALLPLKQVAGKAGNPGLFSEAKLVKGGSNLAPYLQQTAGITPLGSSLLYITLIATLADSSKGNVPIVPSFGGAIAERKGRHYKAQVQFPAQILPGASLQAAIPLNKETAFLMNQLTSNIDPDAENYNPLVSERHVLVNAFDTRATWKMASPTGIPASLLFGQFGARPFVAPSYFFMQEDQNFVVEVNNQDNSPYTPSFIFDGYLQENILGQRVR